MGSFPTLTLLDVHKHKLVVSWPRSAAGTGPTGEECSGHNGMRAHARCYARRIADRTAGPCVHCTGVARDGGSLFIVSAIKQFCFSFDGGLSYTLLCSLEEWRSRTASRPEGITVIVSQRDDALPCHGPSGATDAWEEGEDTTWIPRIPAHHNTAAFSD